jgi:hypothetical protein
MRVKGLAWLGIPADGKVQRSTSRGRVPRRQITKAMDWLEARRPTTR